MEIWTIKLYCCGARKICHIPSNFPLHALCLYILGSFQFCNDHLHEFFISKSGRPYKNDSYAVKDENLLLSDIYPLPDKYHLYLHFDFGDSWVFKIMRTRKAPFYDDKIQSPILISESGKNPEQY